MTSVVPRTTAGLASTVAAVALALTACTPAGSSPGTGAPAVAGTTVTTSDGVTPFARFAGCTVHDGRADITCTPVAHRLVGHPGEGSNGAPRGNVCGGA